MGTEVWDTLDINLNQFDTVLQICDDLANSDNVTISSHTGTCRLRQTGPRRRSRSPERRPPHRTRRPTSSSPPPWVSKDRSRSPDQARSTMPASRNRAHVSPNQDQDRDD